MAEFDIGETVEWTTPQGAHRGTVLERHTHDFDFGRGHFAASEADPAYVVVCEGTGLRAAHKAAALRRGSTATDAHSDAAAG